jgi:acyl carrier protein
MDREQILAAARAAVTAMVNGPVSDTDALISSGMIDSLSILKLIARLEEAMNIRLPKESLQPDDFDSIEWIADTVERVARPK